MKGNDVIMWNKTLCHQLSDGAQVWVYSWTCVPSCLWRLYDRSYMTYRDDWCTDVHLFWLFSLFLPLLHQNECKGCGMFFFFYCEIVLLLFWRSFKHWWAQQVSGELFYWHAQKGNDPRSRLNHSADWTILQLQSCLRSSSTVRDSLGRT